MKIVNVASFGSAKCPGGIAEVINRLSYYIRYYEHTVITCVTDKCNQVDNTSICYYSSSYEFQNFVNSFKPDVVVFHSLYEWQQITYSKILRKLKIPYILVFHGGASRDNARKGWLKKKIANCIFFNTFIKYACRVVYLNENELNNSIFRKINDNYAIIPNGVDMPNRPLQPIISDKLVISFISRMDYYGKGLDVLFAAIEKLKEEGWANKVEFAFYGYPNKMISAMIDQLVPMASCRGYVSGPSKREAFEMSNINILPSRSEGMPMTILEAMSYGRPCIVTPMTNMAEIVNDNNCGWVIELNVNSIVSTIQQAYYEFKVDACGYYSRCRNLALKYSWNNVAKCSLELYKEVINEYKSA